MCTRALHPLEEQNEFDSIADEVKHRMKSVIKRQIDKLRAVEVDGEYFVLLSSVTDIVDSY